MYATAIDSKTASNERVKSRKGFLEQSADDLENGLAEFAAERVALKKEIKSLLPDIEFTESTSNTTRVRNKFLRNWIWELGSFIF